MCKFGVRRLNSSGMCSRNLFSSGLVRLMENAFGEASLPSNAEEIFRKFFNEMSTFMINQSESGIS